LFVALCPLNPDVDVSFVSATPSRGHMVRVSRNFFTLCDPSCVSSVSSLSSSRTSESVGRQLPGHLPFDFLRSLLIRNECSHSRAPSIISGPHCGFLSFLAGLHCGSNKTMFLAGFYRGFHLLFAGLYLLLVRLSLGVQP
jgi:hypothetical protein